jgi:protein TonB
MMKRLVLMSCAALVAGAAVVSAQDRVKTVKDLYAAAAYEDALAAVNRLQSDGPQRELEPYRVFSLTALGRHEEAQKAMEALVRADPTYVLDPAETPPRVQEAFTKVQQRLLPAVTKQLYLDARAALDRKDRAEAVAQFEKLLKIIDGAGPASASLGELRVLADGFLDLSRALPGATPTAPAPEVETTAAATPAAPPAAPASPGTGVAATRTPAATAASSSAARTPAATSVPSATGGSAATGAPAASASAGSESRPFPLSQELPSWSPTDTLSRRSTFYGAVTVRIGTDGRVASAEITRSVHPTYDPILLRTARNWRYQPAMRDGKPVQSELMVEVTLRPLQ